MHSMTAPSVLFEQPVDVQLAKHADIRFRVLGVKRCKNPNGGTRKHTYALAEWLFQGRWKRVNDLVQQMRLANSVEHGLGHNPERYANVEGDKVLGETPYEFRIVYHTPLGKTHLRFPATSDEDSPENLAPVLEELVADQMATGGHIEQFVDGIGWVMENAEEDEAHERL